MVNQPNASKTCGKPRESLRSTFVTIPKNPAKLNYFTYKKKMIFSEIQFLSFCETILIKFEVFSRNQFVKTEIVSQKDQN